MPTASAPSLKETMSAIKNRVEQEMQRDYANAEPALYENTFAAMKHMLFLGSGGKRMRPILTALAYNLFGGTGDAYLPYAVAVEHIHTYTLIIDDIQDGDLVRRGDPTCHAKFGVNTAILASARLFERGMAPFHAMSEECRNRARAYLDALHRGQAADLNALTWPNEIRTKEALEFIHAGKTASLLQLALLGGGYAAGASLKDMEPVLDYGYLLGIVFQARDDILSKISSVKELGKSAGTDADANKLTFVSFYDNSPDKAQKAAEQIGAEGIKKLGSYKSDTEFLKQIMGVALTRAT